MRVDISCGSQWHNLPIKYKKKIETQYKIMEEKAFDFADDKDCFIEIEGEEDLKELIFFMYKKLGDIVIRGSLDDNPLIIIYDDYIE